MNILLVLAVLLAPAFASDFAAVEAARPGLRSASAALRANAGQWVNTLRRNGVGLINGGMNNSPLELFFDRRAWTIHGGANHSAVRLQIDHENGTIKGGANGSPVDLHFYWSTERIITRGGANLSQVDLLLDWGAKTLTGTANNSSVRVVFDLEAGTVKGHANNAPVDLKHDAVSGRVTGSLNARPVDFTLTNLDLTDLLPHFFLFLK